MGPLMVWQEADDSKGPALVFITTTISSATGQTPAPTRPPFKFPYSAPWVVDPGTAQTNVGIRPASRGMADGALVDGENKLRLEDLLAVLVVLPQHLHESSLGDALVHTSPANPSLPSFSSRHRPRSA
jgi:hypothetical protein